jgi:D-alanyl-D-alanine carboxypeptidase
MKTVSAPGIGSLSSTDKLLRVYPGLEGGKTGTTSDAGACFVATAKRNGVSLVSVVLGADGGDARFVQTTRLFDWGFRHTGRRVLAHAGDRAGSVAVKGATGAIPVRIASSVPSLFFDLTGPVRSHLEVGRPTQLPVFAGERLADVVFTQGGRVVGRAPAVSIASVASVAATAAPVPVADIPGRFVATRYVPVTTVAAFDPAGKLQRRMVVPSEIGTPVKRGQRLGQVVYAQGSRVVATVPIVAAEDVARPDAAASFRIALLRGWRALVLALIESPRV